MHCTHVGRVISYYPIECVTTYVLCTVDGRLDVNVALKRPAYMSSVRPDVYGPHGPDLGVDGDKTNCHGLLVGNSLVHTLENEHNPWFAVDLGVALHVEGVNLTNRLDMNGK